MTRNEAREILMQMMYEMDTAKNMNKEAASLLAEERLAGNHIERGKALLINIIDNLDAIDEEINKFSKSWKTNRMPKVDLAVIRLAVGEMKYAEDVPDAVAINEAINLAKKYSTDQSSRYVHGVLGAIAKNNG
ncbi:MAG: transcription antitermination factor NusB [Firmicutes bacterium]|nr:transcription antitermination factor NusB [Bacillota bacterium]MBR6799887.1 transcription antitermination factor NusB [Bacillota bacterium]